MSEASSQTTAIEPAARGRSPFDQSGVVRDEQGRARYAERPDSLVHLLRASVDRDGAATAIVEVGGRSLSYGELWDGAARVAGGLREQGIGRGDRVAIRLGNGADWVLAFFGCQLLGAVAVPVNTRFTDDEVAYVVRDSGAAFTFAPDAPLPDGEPTAVDDLAPDDLAAIFYTSGTTGFPKGAMTSHRNFTTNNENCFRVLDTPRAELSGLSTLVSVPLFHVTGCNSQLLPMLEWGGRIEILSGPLDLDGFFAAVGEHGVNQLVSVPAIYHAVMRHPKFAQLDVSGVRWVSYGGAPIAESLVQRIKDAFPNARVGNGFGLTETSSLSTFLPHEEAAEHADSVGFADARRRHRHRRARRRHRRRRAARARRQRRAGLLEQARRDRRDVRRTAGCTPATSRASTHDGLLYIVDRKKDMINRGGENVY